MTQLTEQLFIEIGRRRYQVADFRQASEMFCAARDRAGEGASKTPWPNIVTADGRVVARVSYNGRVWPPEEWHRDQVSLYDPAGGRFPQ